MHMYISINTYVFKTKPKMFNNNDWMYVHAGVRSYSLLVSTQFNNFTSEFKRLHFLKIWFRITSR